MNHSATLAIGQENNLETPCMTVTPSMARICWSVSLSLVPDKLKQQPEVLQVDRPG